jgi:hypothetical protein
MESQGMGEYEFTARATGSCRERAYKVISVSEAQAIPLLFRKATNEVFI